MVTLSGSVRSACRLCGRRERGFTLLEVMIALAILAVSLLILVGAQSNAARMTVQADRILIGTMLAQQKLAELELLLDSETGFSEQDEIAEDGDFEQQYPRLYPEYRWQTFTRKVDLRSASPAGFEQLLGLGAEAEEEAASESDTAGMPEGMDLASMFPMDMVSEQLARYIREITVVVSWDFNGDYDEVVMTTHVIKPAGPQFVSPEDQQTGATGSSAGSGSSGNNASGGGSIFAPSFSGLGR